MIDEDDPRQQATTQAENQYAEDYITERREERDAQQRVAALMYALQLPRPPVDHTPQNVVAAAEAFLRFLRGDPP